MTDHNIGRLFVAIQVVLLVALIATPAADHWPTPRWLSVLGLVAILAGMIVVILATTRLGSALTANPMPKEAAQLATAGFYAVVRHPIYSGVLLATIGVAVRSGNAATAAVGLVLVVFFHIKARWEETKLAAQYPDYQEYARRTPRFVPGLRPRS